MPSGPILLIEDNPTDAELVRYALKKIGLKRELVTCETGDDGLDYLMQKGEYSDAIRPKIILLDLNLPGIDGRELLQTVKQNQALKAIPIVVVTTSNDAQDVQECYQFGANSFMTKPMDPNKYVDAFQSLRSFWFDTAELPNGHSQ